MHTLSLHGTLGVPNAKSLWQQMLTTKVTESIANMNNVEFSLIMVNDIQKMWIGLKNVRRIGRTIMKTKGVS